MFTKKEYILFSSLSIIAGVLIFLGSFFLSISNLFVILICIGGVTLIGIIFFIVSRIGKIGEQEQKKRK